MACTFFTNSTNTTSATGFQLIAQLASSSEEVGRIYTSHTTDRFDPASVQVEVNGTYWLTVLPIVEGRRILGSTVEYTEQISVLISADNTTSDATTSGNTVILLSGKQVRCGASK